MGCSYTGKDFSRSFRTVRKNTIQVAQDIPEAQYGYRVTPDTRSVAETLAHVAAQTRWHHRLHGIDRKTFMGFEDFGKYMQEVTAYAASLTTKPLILKSLEEDGAEFAAFLDGLTDAQLAETVGFPPPIDPPQKTRFELLLGAKEHEMHHRAQLMVVQRLLGIVPHLTRERQARQAGASAAAPARA